MNKFQRQVHKNLRRYINDGFVTSVLVKPNKRSKMYKKVDGRLITHRALAKIVRNMAKERAKKLNIRL